MSQVFATTFLKFKAFVNVSPKHYQVIAKIEDNIDIPVVPNNHHLREESILGR